MNCLSAINGHTFTHDHMMCLSKLVFYTCTFLEVSFVRVLGVWGCDRFDRSIWDEHVLCGHCLPYFSRVYPFCKGCNCAT